MAGGSVSTPDIDVTQMRIDARPPRRWNRGLWIRFALAITPTIIFAILGYLQTH